MKVLTNPILKLEHNFKNTTLQDRVYYFNEAEPCYQEYASWELESHGEIITKKVEQYILFLNRNMHNFYILNQLDYYFEGYEYTISDFLPSLFQNNTKTDYKKLAKELNKYQKFIINWTRYRLLNNKKIDASIDFSPIKNQVFNINIFLLKVNSNLIDAQESILNELKEIINTTTYEFYFKAGISEITISPHQYLLNQIKAKLNKIKTQKTSIFGKEIKLKKLKPNQIKATKASNPDESQNFPTHIFRNKEAYTLFHTMATKMEKHAQLSFLFRYMSEKENPPLIVCRYAVFRNWFNQQDYLIELETITKRRSDATNNDRVFAYRLTKELLNIKNEPSN